MRELELMSKCPKWNFCSANNCCLDFLMPERAYYPNEPKCRLSKKGIKKLTKGHEKDLPWILGGSFFRNFWDREYWKKYANKRLKPSSLQPAENKDV